ncbi:hypothetical protein [Rhodococcus sp. NPDC058521]|uniref:hypothetical protein n=1 Tax=Rhodococcus sp. NPDC058521 TaxID=3346536 RepID=UPI003647185F
MTRTTETLTAPSVSIPEPLLRAKDSEKVDEAVRIARSGALTVGRNLGRAGSFLGRQGIELARKGAERAQHVPVPQVQAVAEKILPEPEPKPKRTGRKILIALGIGAVAVGGVVFYKSRHREQPPVAPAPPALQQEKPKPAPTPAPTAASAPSAEPAPKPAPKPTAKPKPSTPSATKNPPAGNNGKHAANENSTPPE